MDARDFSRISGARGAFDLGVTWGIIVAAWLVADRLHSWPAFVVAGLVIANRQSALANLAHEAYHGLCFRGRRVNDAVGSWLYAYPVGIPFEHDRRRHLSHHRLVGLPADPDWPNYANLHRETAWLVLRHFLGRLCGSLFVITLLSLLRDRRMPLAALEEEEKDGRPQRPVEFRWLVVTQLLLALGLAGFFHGWTYLALWLLPLITVATTVNQFRAYVEHAARDDDARPEERLSDFAAGWVEQLCISPCHFHLHGLHHHHPSVPHYRLPRMRQSLARDLGSYPLPVRASYRSSFLAHLGERSLISARPRSPERPLSSDSWAP